MEANQTSHDIILPHNYIARDYQIDFWKAMQSKIRAVLVWHRRCLAKGTQIILSNGSYKNIEDIVKGDEILCWDGKEISIDVVKNQWYAGQKKVFRASAKGNINVICTSDHKFAFCFQGSKYKANFRPLIDHSPGNLGLFYKGFPFTGINNPDLAEFLGYMMTDGYCSGDQQPKFTNTNIELLNRVEFLAKSLFDCEVIWRQKGNAFDLGFSNGTLGGRTPNKIKDLFKKGNNNYSKDKRKLPSILWDMDQESILRFLAAVISGDGCIYSYKKDKYIDGKIVKKNHEISIHCGESKTLAFEIYWLLRKIGILSQEPIKDRRHCNWTIRVWEQEFVLKLLSCGPIFGKIDKQNFCIENINKTKKRICWNSLYRAKINIKEEIEDLIDCYDIETENHHNFFANGYLVHNSGKEKTCWNYLVCKAAQKPGIYYYLFPTFSQGRKILWDGMDKEGFRFIDHVPKDLIQGMINSTEMKLRLKNGSLIQVIGTDSVDRIVGTNPVGCVFSEYSLQDPKAWEFLRPILAENKGWAVFNFTPRGINAAKDLFDMAQNNPEWFCQRLTIEDTGILTAEDIKREKDSGMSEDMIQQEFYVSFSMGIQGSYYAKYLDESIDEGRIGNVPVDKYSQVHTAWDIGYGDSCSIIFYQVCGNEIHIVDHYECSGEGLSHYVEVINSKKYIYGSHFAPHDIDSHAFSSGLSAKEVGASLGIRFITLPTLKLRVEDGIEAVRSLFPRFWIDQNKCKALIKSIQNYRKTWNDKMGMYTDKPLHDNHSHNADSLRYLALAVKIHIESGKYSVDDKQADKWFELYNPTFK